MGETGWASVSGGAFGSEGSRAADEYKMHLYHGFMRNWSMTTGIKVFYFEAFDEKWKDAGNPMGSENHFGLITVDGKAKYPLWWMVDQGNFEGLTRNGNPITKAFGGDENVMWENILSPPLKSEMGSLAIKTVNEKREVGHAISESTYIILHDKLSPEIHANTTYPSAPLKLNPWEGTCSIELTPQDIKGNTKSSFEIGFQTGTYAEGNQENHFITFGTEPTYSLGENWKSVSISMSEILKSNQLKNVTAPLYLRGANDFDGKKIELRNIYFSR